MHSPLNKLQENDNISDKNDIVEAATVRHEIMQTPSIILYPLHLAPFWTELYHPLTLLHCYPYWYERKTSMFFSYEIYKRMRL